MKKIVVISIIIILFSCKSKNPGLEKFEILKLENVPNAKKEMAYNLGKRLMSVCNTFRLKSFTTEEATESVIKNTNLEKMTLICQKINQRNGKFIDLNLINVVQYTTSNDLVFRYNINYEKKFFERELKVTVNSNGKISAISTKEIRKIIK